MLSVIKSECALGVDILLSESSLFLLAGCVLAGVGLGLSELD